MNFHRLGGITALAGCSTSDALSSDIHRIPINRPAQIIQCHHYLRGDADKTAFVERQQEFAALQRGQPVGDREGRAPLHQAVHGLHDGGFGLEINRARRLVDGLAARIRASWMENSLNVLLGLIVASGTAAGRKTE